MLASIRFGYHIQCDNFQIGKFGDDLTTWHIVMFIDRFPTICLQMLSFFANIVLGVCMIIANQAIEFI